MVKFLKNKPDKEKVESEESDMEIEDGIEENESIDYPNDEEKLKEFTNKIREEFERQYKSKGKNPNWLETMISIGDVQIPEGFDADDDIKRELIFYNITHKNTIQGILKLKKFNEKLNRPGDFFAEMLKGDNQMGRIRKKIVTEQQRIKKFEEKKHKLQNIKFAKAMKDSQNKIKAEYKKKTKEGIERWKKNIKSNPNAYDKIDEFFEGKDNKKNKFKSGGKKDFKFKNNKFQKKGAIKRPGKLTRINKRNKKFSKKSK